MSPLPPLSRSFTRLPHEVLHEIWRFSFEGTPSANAVKKWLKEYGWRYWRELTGIPFQRHLSKYWHLVAQLSLEETLYLHRSRGLVLEIEHFDDTPDREMQFYGPLEEQYAEAYDAALARLPNAFTRRVF